MTAVTESVGVIGQRKWRLQDGRFRSLEKGELRHVADKPETDPETFCDHRRVRAGHDLSLFVGRDYCGRGGPLRE